MRLNGWQRIGIVASVIWAIGAPIYKDNEAQRAADESFYRSYDSCRDVPSNDPEQCLQRASRAHDSVPRYHFIWRAERPSNKGPALDGAGPGV